MAGLEKNISAPMLSIYGAGTILGAGIYVLIGKIAGEAGYWMPVAFLLAALVASINGLVYAELSTRSPSAGGPSDYVHKAFNKKWLTILIGWMIVATGVVSAATIANGFTGYLQVFFDIPDWLVKSLLIITLGGIAAAGAKESAWFMAVTTTLGVIGLIWILYLGFVDGNVSQNWENFQTALPSLSESTVLVGVLSATFLSVYAFIGFEDIVHVAEEVEEPKRAIPIAIVFALLLCALLYVAVSLAALMVITPEELAKSDAPLVEVNNAAGYPEWPIVTLSLWIILNGALAQIIMASRVMYSLGNNSGAPEWLAQVNQNTKTPVVATVLSAIAVLLLAVGFPLATLAAATSLIMLLIFSASNLALIVLEKRNAEAPFDVPVFVPYIGLMVCCALIIGKFLVGGGGH